jgi:hypothetical protein
MLHLPGLQATPSTKLKPEKLRVLDVNVELSAISTGLPSEAEHLMMVL